MTQPNAKLRTPFPPDRIGKLPRSTCRDCTNSARKRCDRHTWVSNCPECHGGHSSATMHLEQKVMETDTARSRRFFTPSRVSQVSWPVRRRCPDQSILPPVSLRIGGARDVG